MPIPADLAKVIPVLQQKILGMKKKRTETGSLIDQQVWNTNGLRDSKRQALGKGTATISHIASSVLQCIELYCVFICHLPRTCPSGFAACTEDIQGIVNVLQNK